MIETRVKRFSPETKAALENQKYVIYELTGQSIKSLIESGRKFWTDWHKDYTDFEALPSRLSEVAVNPDPKKFYLKDSNRKTLDEQQELVKNFSVSLSKGRNRIPRVQAILGEAPDYVELSFRHLKETGERLFGEKYQKEEHWTYTRTATLVGTHVISIGYFRDSFELYVDFRLPKGYEMIWTTPLIVPA